MEVLPIVGAGLFMALVLERLVELLVKPPLPEAWKPIIPYISAVVGVAAAFAFSIDLVGPTLELFGVTPAVPWAGRLLTGLAIGGGSNLLHDLWPAG